MPAVSTAPVVLVVADDLTGACDAALPFRAAGHRVTVGLASMPEDVVDVVAISTETRDSGSRHAASVVADAVRTVSAAGATRLFKKVDSRLRGAVGAELVATLDESGAPFAVLAPALPRLGRRVLRGVLHTPDGPPVHVAGRLAETAAGLSVRCIGAGMAPAGLASAIGRAAKAGARVVVCDAATDGDLRVVIAAVARLDPAPLIAGASGLAGALADVVRPPVDVDPPRPVKPAERVLFVLGSLQPSLREEAARLLAQRAVTRVSPSEVETMPEAVSVMLDTLEPPADVDDGGAAARRLARAVVAALARTSFDAIVCCGGAVAAAVCRALDIDQLALTGALAPGFPLAEVAGTGLPRLFALRSGGFGANDRGLVQAYDRLLRGGA